MVYSKFVNSAGQTSTLVTGATYSNPTCAVNGAAGGIGGTLYGTSVTFAANTSSADAGAIMNYGTFNITDSMFEKNESGAWGGAIAIYKYNGNLTVTNCKFNNNYARTAGGAIENLDTTTIVGSLFTGNTAGWWGGAIVNDGSLCISSSTFTSNYAGRSGGAIYNWSFLNISNSTFSGNTASTAGGAICNSGTVSLTGAVTLVTAKDTLYNTSVLNWDLTGGTGSYGRLVNYQYLTNYGSYAKMTITVSASQQIGTYVIATGTFTTLTNKNTFSITGVSGVSNVSITINGSAVNYNGQSYSLTTSGSNLLLAISGTPVPEPATYTRFIATTASPVTLVSGMTYTNPASAALGGAGYVCADARLTGTSVTFSGNSASDDGGAIYNYHGTVSLTGAVFKNNRASDDGGSIFNYKLLTVTNTLFQGNSSGYRGGAICNLGVLNIGNVTFSGNSAKTAGGAVYNGGTVNLTGSVTLATSNDTLYNLSVLNWDLTGGTGSYGKLVNYQYLTNSGSYAKMTITVGASQTLGNYTIATGDFSTLTGKNSFTITGVTGKTDVGITVNGSIVFYNGLVYKLAVSGNNLVLNIDKASPVVHTRFIATSANPVALVSGTTYTYPSAYSGNGGAGYVQSGAKLTGTSVTFAGNTATSCGGAIYTLGFATISDSKFTGNTSSTGGAICNDGTLNVTRSVFTRNRALPSYGWGGAIFNDNTATITASTFTGNTANWGGAVLNHAVVSITDSYFSNNYATYSGGAVYGGNTNSKATIVGSTFTGNTAKWGGAVAHFYRTTIEDCVFSGNSAATGGAVYCSDSYPALVTLKNVRFSGNTATYGGAVYNTYYSTSIGCTVTLAGIVSLETASDTIYNMSVLNWDLTGGTGSYGKLVNYQYLTNSGSYAKMTITVSASQQIGTYVIATGTFTTLTNKNTFSITGVSGRSNVSITINGSAVSYNGQSYSLKTSGSSLILNIGGSTSSTSSVIYTRFIATTASPVTLVSGATYSIRTASTYGGAGYVNSGAEMTGTSVTFAGNSASTYGGAFINYGTSSIAGAVFKNNRASWGGAINCYDDATNSVINSYFSGNWARMSGGAIFIRGKATISGTTFTSNTAEWGGAIYCFPNGPVRIENSIFSGNSAGTGGAVMCSGWNGVVTLNNVRFIGNTATYGGGAIYNIYKYRASTISLAGTVSLETSSDTIYNTSVLNWDLTGGTGSYGKLVNYQYLTNSGSNAKMTITVSASQQIGTYVIATGTFTTLTNKNTFSITGVSGRSNVSITINGSAVNYNGQSYSLTTSNGNLLLAISGCTVPEPAAYTRFIATTASPVTLVSGTTYTNSTAYSGNGGAGYVQSGAKLTGSSVTFAGNTATTNGGAFYNYYGTVSLTDAVFRSNRALNGGAIYNYHGTVSLTGTEFRNNTASDGAAVFNYYGTVSLTGAVFQNNRSLDDGGAVFNYKVLTVTNTLFQNNTASWWGGAICNWGVLNIGNATFSGNSATTAGGAIYNACNSSNIGTVSLIGAVTLTTAKDTLYNLSVLNWDLTGGTGSYGKLVNYQYLTNSGSYAKMTITVSASQQIGTYVIATGTFTTLTNKNTFSITGVSGRSNVSITINGSAVNYNGQSYSLTTSDGNLLLAISGTPVPEPATYTRFIATTASPVTLVSGTTYTNPTAYSGNGGAGYVQSGAKLTGTSVTFAGNTASMYGGAIYSLGTSTVSNSMFTDNSAASLGGAFCNDKVVAIADISDSYFGNNFAGGWGGAFYNAYHADISGTTFTANTSKFGGAILNHGSMSIENSIFSGNSASSGGAIYCEVLTTTRLTLKDVRFVGNTAATYGGAIYNEYDSIISLAGTVSLETASDTIYNMSVLNWDLTGGTGSYGKLVNYQYLTNAGSNAKMTITVSASQQVGDYVIATGDFTTMTNKNKFAITGVSGVVNVGITVNGDSASYNGLSYMLAVSGSDLVLKIATAPAPAAYERFIATTASPVALVSGTTYTNPVVYTGNGAAGEVQTGGILTCTGANFIDNHATALGGAIYNLGTVTLTDSVFTGNLSNGDGGAVYNMGMLTVTGSTFGDGTAWTGGVISNNGLSCATVGNSLFSGNSAKYGGAILNRGTSTGIITGSTFSGNQAQWGGAVYSEGKATLDISGSTFTNNSVSQHGGAVYNTSTMSVAGSTFSGNAAKWGGAIYNTKTMSVGDVVFTGNTATSGGAIYNTGSITVTGKIMLGSASDTVANKGTITVDAAKFDLTGGYALVVDAVQEGWLTGKIITSSAADYAFEIVNGDGYLVVRQNLVKVNSAWSGNVFGDIVLEGFTYGINAFATLTAAQIVLAEGGTVTNGVALLQLGGGTSGNKGDDAFAAAGTTVTFENFETVGDINCGTAATETAQSKEIYVSAVSARRLYLGENANHIVQTGEPATLTAEIVNSSFTSGIFCGGNVDSSTVLCNASVRVSASTAGLVFGGVNTKGASADAPSAVTLRGDRVITLNNALSGQYVAGGSLIGSNSSETAIGDITLNISGGTYQTVIGGSLIQSAKNVSSAITGDISITVGGDAKIGTLYGGSMALKVEATRQENIIGNISLTVDVSDGAAITGKVFCGGAAYSIVNGDTNLTVKGAGDGGDFFGATVISCDSAYANWGSRYVTGDRSLSFSNFNGRCQSNIYLVDTVNVDATSEVTLTYLMSNLNGVNWNISADDVDRVSVTLAESTLGEFAVDLAGSAMNLSCELEDGDEWIVFKSAGSEVLSNLGDATIFLNGDFLTETDTNLMTGETYQLEYREDGTLVASKLA